MEIFENISRQQWEKEINKLQLALSKQRLIYQCLPTALQSLTIPEPIDLNTIEDIIIRQRLLDRYHKILQRMKSEMMRVYIATQEAKTEEIGKKCNETYVEMKENLHSASPTDRKLTEIMTDLLRKRILHNNKHLMDTYRLKLRFFRQRSDGHDEFDMNHRWSFDDQELDMNRCRSHIFMDCAPTLFENTIHHFTFEQLAFLNRGPTYVPPCQVHLSSSSLNQDQILTRQIAPLRRQLTKVFTRYPVNLSHRMKFENEITQLFQEQFFSISIPMSLQERSIYEKELMQSIRIQLKSDQLILRRTADNNNTYYLGPLNEFNFQTQKYMEQHADCYEIIGLINNESNTEEKQLQAIIQSIDLALVRLEQRKFITKDHLSKLSLQNKKQHLKLPYLYFLPEIHENNNGSISFQPRISSSRQSPIHTLATYLEQLLQPLFEQISRSTFIDNGSDFMKKILNYSLRTTTTQFITFEIHHLNTHVSHADLCYTLSRLLMNPFIYNRHDRLTNDGIEKLTDLFLRNNIFKYNGKIYRQVKGCSFNFPLSRLLLDIYLYDWQFSLFRTIRITDEFYGLYHHRGFFIWNESSMEKIEAIFHQINQSFQAPIHMTFTNGLQSHFLNIHIENRTGHFYTRVYSDPNKQPFLLPYVTGHPRLIYRKWFRFALLRAGLYCTNLEDFQDERLNIELTFLANGYSLDFVEYHLHKFFQLVSQPHMSSFIELDQQKYDTLRSHLFSYISLQKQNLLERQQLEKQQQHRSIQFDYLFDWGCRWKFNDAFYTKWIEILEKDPKFKSYHLKVHLHSKHCYLSNALLAQ
jgi:hypothetical protein